MAELYLPPRLIAEQRMAHATAIDEGTVDDPLARQFTALLQRISPRLMMVRARDRVPLGCPLTPGYYHVLSRNDDAPITVAPVHEHGKFVEPDSRLFDRLAAGDLHDPRTLREVNAQQRIEAAAAQRDRDRLNADRQEKLRDVVNAGTRAFISMDRSVPWTQTATARRPR
jgi:hypothetical protein